MLKQCSIHPERLFPCKTCDRSHLKGLSGVDEDQRCTRGDQPKIPLSSKIWQNPPCPAKPDPPPLGEKYLVFFREISGKFRVFREISLNLTGFSLNLVKLMLI